MTFNHFQRLALGVWVAFDDEKFKVVGLNGTTVMLQDIAGRPQVILVAALLNSPGFRVLDSGRHRFPHPSLEQEGDGGECGLVDELSSHPDGRDGGDEQTPHTHSPDGEDGPGMPTLDTVDRNALAQLLEGPETQKALNFEAELIALAKRDQAEPGRVSAHVEELAAKLGISARQVYRKRKAYEEHGLWGLVDRRALPLRSPLANLDTRIVAAMQQQAAYETRDSTGTISRFITRVKRRLEQQFGKGVVPLPSDVTLRRAAKHLFDPAGTFGSAPRRRSDASRPQRVYANSPASRPGEVVMLDTTRLDVLALEPVTGKAVAVELTIALDLATRSILAWRLTPAETKAVDAIGLLADMVSPEPMREGWEETVRFNILNLPVDRLVAVDERLALAAARPVIVPEKLVVDNGKIFVSQAMVGACLRLGIDLQFARLRKATDKPEVERAFGTIRTQFAQHVAGYTGQSVDKRGDQVEAAARWTIEDLEEFFAEYVLYVYQRQPHGGLRLTGRVHVPLSPNDAYAHLVAIHGYVAIPRNPYLFLELLPAVFRQIRPEGVSIDKQLFSSEVTYKYRNTASPYPRADGAWPFRVDPRNRLFVYFKDPADGRWHAIPWVHAHRNARPFSTRTLLMVREFLATRLGKAAVTSAAIGDALEALQGRMDAPEAGTVSWQRRFARDAHHGDRARRDLAGAGLNPAEPSDDDELEDNDESHADGFDFGSLRPFPTPNRRNAHHDVDVSNGLGAEAGAETGASLVGGTDAGGSGDCLGDAAALADHLDLDGPFGEDDNPPEGENDLDADSDDDRTTTTEED